MVFQRAAVRAGIERLEPVFYSLRHGGASHNALERRLSCADTEARTMAGKQLNSHVREARGACATHGLSAVGGPAALRAAGDAPLPPTRPLRTCPLRHELPRPPACTVSASASLLVMFSCARLLLPDSLSSVRVLGAPPSLAVTEVCAAGAAAP